MARRRQKKTEAPAAEAEEAVTSVRADKWLWAARCFKTRSQATDACSNDRCKVNDRTVKASYLVKIGDTVDVECPGGRRILVVEALAERRGSATAAALLFDDRSPEPPPRDPPPGHTGGVPSTHKPSKQERRQLRKVRGY
jgi:ribosome-associated heat shock protein Hsp15